MIFTIRFEEEILTSQKIDDVRGNGLADSTVIIGSSTFDKVQAQLNSQLPRAPLQAVEVTTAAQKPDNSTVKQKLTFSGVDYFTFLVLPFWCRLTLVVPVNPRVCVCV